MNSLVLAGRSARLSHRSFLEACMRDRNIWLIKTSEHRNEWVAVVRHNPSRQYAVMACSRFLYGENMGTSFKRAMDTFYANRKTMVGLQSKTF